MFVLRWFGAQTCIYLQFIVTRPYIDTDAPYPSILEVASFIVVHANEHIRILYLLESKVVVTLSLGNMHMSNQNPCQL